jgi:uncharacterized protein (TIGR02246 family)
MAPKGWIGAAREGARRPFLCAPRSLTQGGGVMSLRLEDIELIRQVKHRYFRGIDMGDIETLRDLFTPDVKVLYVGGTYRWELSGRDQMLASIGAAFNSNAVACHTGHHPEITVHTDTTAEGIWYLTDIFYNLAEKTRTTGSALYRDKYVKQDGRWRICETTYQRIYEMVEKLAEMPALTAHHLAGIPARRA